MKARILSFYQVVLAWLYLRIPREKLQNKIVKKFLGLFLCFCGGGDWINFCKKTHWYNIYTRKKTAKQLCISGNEKPVRVLLIVDLKHSICSLLGACPNLFPFMPSGAVKFNYRWLWTVKVCKHNLISQ